jgi:hypothetical protein
MRVEIRTLTTVSARKLDSCDMKIIQCIYAYVHTECPVNLEISGRMESFCGEINKSNYLLILVTFPRKIIFSRKIVINPGIVTWDVHNREDEKAKLSHSSFLYWSRIHFYSSFYFFLLFFEKYWLNLHICIMMTSNIKKL